MKLYTWNRRDGYECSSKGDRRLSAFYATLPNGNSIEHEYQCTVKGYSSIKDGKGNPPLKKVASLFEAYKALWRTFFDANPLLLEEAKALVKPHQNCFSDMFATSEVNQARAIATILNDEIGGERHYHYHVDGSVPAKSILVFGSNLSGIHGKGAALLAREVYGAELGVAEGMTDCAYAIPTISYLTQGASRQPPLSLKTIDRSIELFKQVAIANNKGNYPLRFFVTRIGCGLAGFHDRDIAPLFRNSPTNCSFAHQWAAYLEP